MSVSTRHKSSTWYDDPMYPSSDGEPMADNTLQWEWIVTIKGGLETVFKNDPNVFIAGDLLWYPVHGEPKTRIAPDALVVFGRPKGHRTSYMQWREEGIAPQVVFEVLSQKNTMKEMDRKRVFYERYGVEEFYIYDPDDPRLIAYIRAGDRLQPIPEPIGWTSPRLGVRFEMEDELCLLGPDGERFVSYQDVADQRDEARHERDEFADRAAAERQRAERLAAKLRELGIEPEV